MIQGLILTGIILAGIFLIVGNIEKRYEQEIEDLDNTNLLLQEIIREAYQEIKPTRNNKSLRKAIETMGLDKQL